MQIGNFGNTITFETSDKKILNFVNFKREVSARWTAHARIGKKPLKQFLGPDTDKVTFSVALDARHGVKPRKTLANIENSLTKGIPAYLVIGGQKVGNGKYVLTSMSETWDEVFNKGELVRAAVSLTLEEYPV